MLACGLVLIISYLEMMHKTYNINSYPIPMHSEDVGH